MAFDGVGLVSASSHHENPDRPRHESSGAGPPGDSPGLLGDRRQCRRRPEKELLDKPDAGKQIRWHLEENGQTTIGTINTIVERGWSTRQAPSTPAIAPEAPIVGVPLTALNAA